MICSLGYVFKLSWGSTPGGGGVGPVKYSKLIQLLKNNSKNKSISLDQSLFSSKQYCTPRKISFQNRIRIKYEKAFENGKRKKQKMKN